MEIHHIGYLCKDIQESISAFIALNYVLEKEVVFDEMRQVNICFLLNGTYRIELIAPVDETSPIYGLLKKYKNTPYHICYMVDDLEIGITQLEEKGYAIFQPPACAIALGNRKVAFLMGSNMGMIELLEEKRFRNAI